MPLSRTPVICPSDQLQLPLHCLVALAGLQYLCTGVRSAGSTRTSWQSVNCVRNRKGMKSKSVGPPGMYTESFAVFTHAHASCSPLDNIEPTYYVLHLPLLWLTFLSYILLLIDPFHSPLFYPHQSFLMSILLSFIVCLLFKLIFAQRMDLHNTILDFIFKLQSRADTIKGISIYSLLPQRRNNSVTTE